MTNYILWGIKDDGAGKKLKVPLDYQSGRIVDAHDKQFHTQRVIAEAALPYQPAAEGIGMVFSDDDPYFFIDIDHGLADDGNWRPDVQAVIDHFPGAYTERSYSGDGLHIIGRYSRELPGPRWTHARKPDVSFDLLATNNRYVALTGTEAQGNMETDLTDALEAFITERLLKPKPVEIEVVAAESDDEFILSRAMKAKSAGTVFGGKATFEQIWTASDTLKTFFPDKHGLDKYDASEVDMALAQRLAYWCGNNQNQIKRLMLRSKLVREKWTQRPDYLTHTIEYACSRQDTVFQPETADTAGEAAPELRAGLQYLTPTQQLEIFQGCVYVRDRHRALLPDGALLKPEQFRAHFGGYIFAMDSLNDKTTTDAWKAFTENQAYRCERAISTAFNPSQKFGVIQKGHVNVYVPYEPDIRSGDITPFLTHIQKLLPDAGDRDILLSYMAACIQQKGTKFQWCPVIQGTEGNGKTILYSVLEYALGVDYCHLQDPEDIKNTFNVWIENKLLVGVEEIHTNGRYEIANRLKTMITNNRIALQGKGADQRTGYNVANFILFSNYKDAVLKTESDRRYAVFYTAQQEAGDLQRDGMHAAYFDGLYEWLRQDGYAYVTQYLSEREITVHTTGRAPRTSSSGEAISESRSLVEQLILDAIEEGEEGFTREGIRKDHILPYLKRFGVTITPHSSHKALKKIGFDRVVLRYVVSAKVRFYIHKSVDSDQFKPN